MKKILSLVLALTMLLGSAMILSSCEAPEDAGAEVRVYLGENVYDFDPTDYYTNSNADQLMNLIYEPLFTIDEDGDLDYAAAEDYEIDEEKRTITIELRETYWSDGNRVKAEEYVYAWRALLLEPTKANPAAALLYDIENALEIKQGLVSPSEFGARASLFEITIQCREGANYEQLLKNLASVSTSPIRQDAVDQAPTYWSKTSNILVTNGPFKISNLNYSTGEFVLERNVGYHQSPAILDYDDEVNPYKLISFIAADGNKLEYTYEDVANKIVFYAADAPVADRNAANENVLVADDLSTYTYVFNVQNPLFAKKYVRQALSLAIDRGVIASTLVYAKAADGFLPDTVYQNNQKALIAADSKFEAAEALLEKVNLEGIDKSFTLTISDDEKSVAIAKMVAGTWNALGFDVTVDTVSTTNTVIGEMEITDSTLQMMLKEASKGNADFDVIGLDWQMYSADAFVSLCAFTTEMNGNGVEFFKEDATQEIRPNIIGWSNEAYDAYIKDAYNATDATVRTEKLQRAEALLVDSAVVVPIVYNQNFAYVSEDFSGVCSNGLGNFILTKAELDDYKKYIENK